MSTFRTTEGLEVTIRPVSMLLIGRIRDAIEAEMRVQGQSLDPPKYSVTTATGAVETFEHDDESATSPKDKAALTAYRAATAKLESEQNKRTSRMLFRRGVVVTAVPAGWAEELAADGVIVPTDPVELRLEYIQMELLKTAADIQGAIMAITELSMTGASQEDLAAAQKSFLDRVERQSAGADHPAAA
jgi:hypothetical protein